MFVCVVWLLLHTDLVRYVNGIQIQECYNDAVEAVENTISPVTCADYTGLVTWRYQLPIADTAMTQIGTCGVTCNVDSAFPPTFGTLTWLSASSSRLNLSSTVTARQYANTTLFCGMEQCNLAINVNAVLGALAVNLSNTDNGWTVTGTVGITKVFSSNEQYRCVWSRRYRNEQYTAVTTKILFPEPNPNNEDKSGTCDFTDSMPNTTGTYTYRVQVYPGATEKTDSSVVIASPPVPSISCTPNTGYVPEGTDVSCTCSGSVGKPAGRLVWVRRINNVDTTIKEGGYGQDSLQLTMTVNRSHDGNKLRCDVDWVTDTTGHAYTVNVARTASYVTFGIGGNKELTVNESDLVTFDCQSRGRPSPELQLAQGNTVLQRAEGGKLSLSEVTTRLSHTITAQCDNTGLYTCSAHNGVGDTQRDTAQLYVNCSPRQEPAPTDSFKLNYEGRLVQLSVNMLAFPLPDKFNFAFHGPANNVSESVTPGKLHSSCWNTFAAYELTCIVIVIAITPKNAGFYSLQIGNSVGHSDIDFELTYFESETGKGSPNGLIAGAAIGIGVTLALVLVIAGVVVVCLWRRHWVLPCASSSAKGCNSRKCHQQAESPRESAAQEGNENANFHEMQEETPESQNQYEPLRLQDIGAKSEYADFTPRVNAGMTSASGKGDVYANTRLADVKV